MGFCGGGGGSLTNEPVWRQHSDTRFWGKEILE
jgi:hypothetical protein